MSLIIRTFILGPLENNTYLLADDKTGQCAVIDPSFNAARIGEEIAGRGWTLAQVWLTHAHFDHMCGLKGLLETARSEPDFYLHPADLPLYGKGGLGDLFGMRFEAPARPPLALTHGQALMLGSARVEVRHTPGHSPGHVIFHLAGLGAVFCGDLVFQGSVGRTDLEGGDQELLFDSIASQILSLPPETRLLSGHGGETMVGEELKWNPYLR